MIPTLSQQLQAIKLRLEETVFPELPETAKFAREQMSFILASLNWILETRAHEYRYEVVENQDYRALLEAVAAAGASNLPGALRQTLAEPGPSPDDARIPLDRLSDQNKRLKALAADVFAAIEDGPSASALRDLFMAQALRQGARESAYYKATGFTQSEQTLGALLGETPDK